MASYQRDPSGGRGQGLRDNRLVNDVEFRPCAAAVLRPAGAALVGLALLVLVCVVVALVAHTGIGWVLLLAALGILAVGIAALVQSRLPMVRLTDTGFELRRVVGAGPAEGRWTDVTEVATSYVDDLPVLLLELRHGQSTTIPVGALAVDREDFVRAVRDRLVGPTPPDSAGPRASL